MKLQDQVVSLELSKRLKELGVKQESHFKWCIWDKEDMFYTDEKDRLYTQEQWEDYTDEYNPPESEFYSAFTLAELGELLPYKIVIDGKEYYYREGKQSSYEWVRYTTEFDLSGIAHEEQGGIKNGTNRADARAKVLIYLIENKLITLDEETKSK